MKVLQIENEIFLSLYNSEERQFCSIDLYRKIHKKETAITNYKLKIEKLNIYAWLEITSN